MPAHNKYPDGLYQRKYSDGDHWEWLYLEDGIVYESNKKGVKYRKSGYPSIYCLDEMNIGSINLVAKKGPPTPEELEQQMKQQRKRFMKFSCKMTMLVLLAVFVTFFVLIAGVGVGAFVAWTTVLPTEYLTGCRFVAIAAGGITSLLVGINCWNSIPCLQFNIGVQTKTVE